MGLRYFFNARGAGHYLTDRRGDELLDEHAAREKAVATARELAEGPLGDHWRAWAFEVSDGTGRTVFTLPVTEAVGQGSTA